MSKKKKRKNKNANSPKNTRNELKDKEFNYNNDTNKNSDNNLAENLIQVNSDTIESNTLEESVQPKNDSNPATPDIPQKNKHLNIKKAIIIGSLAVLVLGSGAILCYNTSKLQDKSYSGIYLENQPVSKLNEEELQKKIDSILSDKIENTKLHLQIEDETISPTLAEVGVSYNIDEITNDILVFNKSGNIFIDTIKRISLLINNYDYIPKPIIDEETLLSYINNINDKYSIEAKNAMVTITNSTISTQPETYGKKVDIDKLQKDIINVINQDSINSNIEVSFVTTTPVLTEEVAKNMEILGTYKTPLVSTNKDRTSNIKLFLSKLNMTILAPDEEFSCNKRAGSRERSDGYKAAPGYVNGEVVPIVAGGICQGTTTIYNALLYADLEITERHPHSMPVTYASNGRDAAIAGNYKDLRFKNNTNNPIILNTYVTNDGYVVATIWGIKEEDNKKIEISVNHINSKAADAYKKTYINGELIKTELLSRDRYK